MARQPREPGPLRIGWLGRLTWQKAPERALRASFVLSLLGVRHRLLLGGDGPERERLRRLVAASPLGERVRLFGHVADTEAFHADLDVLLMTSRAEGLPYTGLDAMARGLPVVAFDVPGVRDLVQHGATGLLAPDGDCGALAAALARLDRDRELAQTLGAAARARVEREFALEEQLDRLCRLYRELSRAARTTPLRLAS
jgi:glycosyltransferase involved in cell wall biosynthesis